MFQSDSLICPMQGLPERGFTPILASSRYNLVMAALGNGLVGIYKSKLPFREPVDLQTDSFRRPLYAILMAFVIYWQYSRMK